MPELRRFPQFLRRPQASAYLFEVWGLQYTANTLARLCCQGRGPGTVYDGRRALHTPEALDTFARSRIRLAPQKDRSTQVEAAAP